MNNIFSARQEARMFGDIVQNAVIRGGRILYGQFRRRREERREARMLELIRDQEEEIARERREEELRQSRIDEMNRRTEERNRERIERGLMFHEDTGRPMCSGELSLCGGANPAAPGKILCEDCQNYYDYVD